MSGEGPCFCYTEEEHTACITPRFTYGVHLQGIRQSDCMTENSCIPLLQCMLHSAVDNYNHEGFLTNTPLVENLIN
jgi:hypothetical protein